MAKAKNRPRNPGYFENFRNFTKAGAIKFNDEAKARFLTVYAETGRLTYAAECCMICGMTAREHLKNDPAFAAAFDEAKLMYGDRLQQEIHRRGVEGWEEPVINFRENKIVDTIRKFSDRLLELNAKRFVPEYRDKLEVDANIHQSGVLVVSSPDGINVEDWANKFNVKKKDKA